MDTTFSGCVHWWIAQVRQESRSFVGDHGAGPARAGGGCFGCYLGRYVDDVQVSYGGYGGHVVLPLSVLLDGVASVIRRVRSQNLVRLLVYGAPHEEHLVLVRCGVLAVVARAAVPPGSVRLEAGCHGVERRPRLQLVSVGAPPVGQQLVGRPACAIGY